MRYDARVARIFLFIAALLLLVGCEGTHLAGTHDVEMEFQVTKPGATAARAPIEVRLATARIPADVELADPTHVRVTVDEDAAPGADEMLLWRGGLALYRADAAYAFEPKDGSGLTPKTETHPDGTVERYFVGSRAALARALDAGGWDDAHRVLVEPIDAKTARTLAVHEPPAIDLASVVDFKGAKSEKKDIVLYAKDEAKLRADAAALGDARVYLALGRRVMAARKASDLVSAREGRAAIAVHMGDGVEAFERAHTAAELLRTEALPPLAHVATRGVPPSWPTAVMCIVLPLVLSVAWLFFVRRFDRSHPEPWWLVVVTFALGGLSVVPAGLAEWSLMSATPYLNPQVMTYGGQLAAFPVALAVFTFVVGLSEEGAKLAGALFAARRKEFDEPVDGIVYGAASALGFAAVENIKYFAFGRLSSAIIVARTFTSIPAHLFFGAIWGYALGRKLVSRRTSVLLFLGYAALMHGAFDTLLSIDGVHVLALVLNLVLASLFIWLLRRALRHGAVPIGSPDAPPSMARAFFPVGRPGMFALCAIAMHVLAFFLFVIGVGHQVSHQKVTYPFFVVSSTLVALLGLAAYGLAATMPLDVAVDEHGVTFAGRAVPWAKVRGARRQSLGALEVLRLDTTGGVVTLGPGRPDRIAGLEALVTGHLAAR
jgi:RsiW-degrading membrane proteinase PrsW (M82 family)